MSMGQMLARLQTPWKRAHIPLKATTQGLYKSRAENKYDELLPLLALLFIPDLK